MTKRKKLITISVIVTSLITLSLVIFFVNKNINSQTQQSDDQNPVSYIEQLSPTSYSIGNSEYKFKNLNLFKSIDTYYEIDQAQFCYTEFPQKVIPLKYDYYYYNNKDTEDMYGHIIYDLDKYIYSQPIKDTYNLYSDLLNGNINLQNSPGSFNYWGIISRSCGVDTGESVPIYITKIDYSGVDSAYMVIFGYGITFNINNGYSVSINIISKIGNNFAIFQINKDFKDITTNSVDLNDCVEPTNYPSYPLYYHYSKVNRNCIINKLQNNVNQDKLNKITNDILNIFELENS